MQSSDDEWEESTFDMDNPPPQVKGLTADVGRKLHTLLMEQSPTKDTFTMLYYTLKLMVHSPTGPVFTWQYLTNDHVHLLAKQLATLLRHQVQIKTSMVQECYEIIIKISRHFRVKDKTKSVYTQWILASSPDELNDLHVIYKYLSKNNYRGGGTGRLSSDSN
jgi:hypothetical protein